MLHNPASTSNSVRIFRLEVSANPYSPVAYAPAAERARVAARRSEAFNHIRINPAAERRTPEPRPAALPVEFREQAENAFDAAPATTPERGLNGVRPSRVAVAQALRQIAPALTGVRLLDLLGVNHSGRSYRRYVHGTEGRAWAARSHEERAAAGWVALQLLSQAGL
jgi:hypothetical protein